jgi:hypothetical protein
MILNQKRDSEPTPQQAAANQDTRCLRNSANAYHRRPRQKRRIRSLLHMYTVMSDIDETRLTQLHAGGIHTRGRILNAALFQVSRLGGRASPRREVTPELSPFKILGLSETGLDGLTTSPLRPYPEASWNAAPWPSQARETLNVEDGVGVDMLDI